MITNKKMTLYLFFIYILSALCFKISLLYSNINLNITEYIYVFIFTILSIITESLSVVHKKLAISTGFAITIATIYLFDPFWSMLIIGLGVIFRIVNHQGKKYHLFNVPFFKTLFNFSNITISIFLSSFLYRKYFLYLNINSTLKELVIFLQITLTFLIINTIIISILFTILSKESFSQVFKSNFFFGFLNIVSMAPLGYFLKYIYQTGKSGPNILGVLIIMVIILFARYTFVLYIESKSKYTETVKVLMTALEMRDKYTEGHSRNVAKIVRAIGEELNYSDSHIEELELAAYLHDIGKIGIPDSILNKPEKLTEDEYKQIKSHTVIGYDIVKGIKDLGKIPELVRHHHERYDGKGYPDGKKGDELDIDVYILQLADSVDAMSTDRIYRKALSPEQIKAELIKNRGLQFHPKIVDIYLKICDKENLCNSRG